MLNFKYLGEEKNYNVEISSISNTLCSIKGNIPVKNKGFVLSRDGKNDNWNYSEYNTVYKNKNGIITFSNNGSVFVPTVNFISNSGQLDGELSQNVSNYEDIIIPTPIDTEYSKFVKWVPEIPSSGKIEEDFVSFVAEFEVIEQNFDETLGNETTLESRVTQLESDVDYLAMCTDVELGG